MCLSIIVCFIWNLKPSRRFLVQGLRADLRAVARP
jgi:hypothetical protein